VAVMYHALYDAAPESLDNLPGGPEWRSDVEQVPAEARHLAIHDGHLVALTDRDRAAVGPMISMQTLTPEQVRERVAGLAAGGVTEIAYQPAAADVVGDLESFIAAANG
jgi:5,10-methylenetetrahydromethanopterin reductase